MIRINDFLFGILFTVIVTMALSNANTLIPEHDIGETYGDGVAVTLALMLGSAFLLGRIGRD